MILETLELDFMQMHGCDTKISSIACWERIEPQSNRVQWYTLMINTCRSQLMEELAFHNFCG